MESLLDINETAQKLKWHPETVRRFIRDGQLSAVKMGKSWRVRESDLSAFIAPRVRRAHNNGAPRPKPTGDQAAKIAAFLKLADELRPVIEAGTREVENLRAADMIRESHEERDAAILGEAARG
jgi:excisionase family DNA binding protein